MKKRWVLILPVLGLLALALLFLRQVSILEASPGAAGISPGAGATRSDRSSGANPPAPVSDQPARSSKVPATPDDGPIRRVRVNVFAHDGRLPLKPFRIIALGVGREYGDYDPEESGGGTAFVDLEILGRLQRFVVIPGERDLAVLVQDVDLDRGDAVNLVLSRGLQVGGTVVDPRGDPVVNASVSCTIDLPADPRRGGETFANSQDNHEAFTVIGDSLMIFCDSDAQGKFALARLPESAVDVSIGLGHRNITQSGSGLSMRVVLPDEERK